MNRGQYLNFHGNQLSTKSSRPEYRKSVAHNPYLLSMFYGFCNFFFGVCTGSFTKTCVNILANKSVSEFDSDSVVVSFSNSFDESVPKMSMCLVFPITSNL